jgi:hypothetical protein
MTDTHLKVAIAEELNRVETTLCLSTKVIVITEDQLELRVQDGMQKLSTRDFWIAPLSILLTCLATLLTADFKTFSWVASGTLKGLFIGVTAASFVWLVVSLFRIKNFGRREFMASVRAAGSPYNAVVGATTGQSRLQDGGTVHDSLQCRQCGNRLPDPIPDQITRCPACGTVSVGSV